MSKKTETIEIRVSPELKTDLSRASEAEGRSMSDLVRGLIETRVEPVPVPPSGLAAVLPNLRQAAMVGLPVLALATVYLLSAQAPATASAEIRLFFSEVDADGDDVITLPEVTAFVQDDDWVAEPDCAEFGEPCSLAEYAAFQLNRADADGSGDVSYAEFEAVNLRDWAEDFLHSDLDENGILTMDEMVAERLHWAVGEPGFLEEEGIELSIACRAQIEAEVVPGIAETCDFVEEGRMQVAEFDADRDGAVTLLEYLRR